MNAQAAKKTAAPAAKKTAAPAKPAVSLDFSALTVQDVKADEVKHTRGSQLDSSPVLGWLRESYENDQAKAVPVPSPDHAEALHGLLRSAAARLKIGVKVVIKPQDANEKDGVQIVKFLGKQKRNYTPPKKKTA